MKKALHFIKAPIQKAFMLLGILPVPLTGFGVGKVNYHQLWIGDWSLQNWFEILFNGFMKLVLRGIVLSDVMLPREISPVRDDNNQSRHLWSFTVSQDVKVGKKKCIYTYSVCDGHIGMQGKHLAEQHASLQGKKKTTKKNQPLSRGWHIGIPEWISCFLHLKGNITE